MFRVHAELFKHGVPSHDCVFHGVHQANFVIDQLGHVFVARGHNHLIEALLKRHLSQGTNHIVRLNTRLHHDGPTHGPGHFMNVGDLSGKVLRHAGPVRLVFGVNVVTKGFTRRIEHTGDTIGGDIVSVVICTQASKHVNHAVNGTSGLACAVSQIGHGMKGTVQVARPINQE